MTIRAQIRPFVYVSPERRAQQYRVIEAAYRRAVSRYIAKLVSGKAA